MLIAGEVAGRGARASEAVIGLGAVDAHATIRLSRRDLGQVNVGGVRGPTVDDVCGPGADAIVVIGEWCADDSVTDPVAVQVAPAGDGLTGDVSVNGPIDAHSGRRPGRGEVEEVQVGQVVAV